MKKNVAVIFGGASSEHDVSLLSATSVINNIPKDKYDVVLIGITRDGRWFKYDGDIEKIAKNEWESDPSCVPAFIAPDTSIHGIVVLDGNNTVIKLDAVFPVLHGKNGEDGTIQGLLTIAGIPYVGCDSISSGSCMDKGVTNALADAAGIPQVRWIAFNKYAYSTDKQSWLDKAEALGYPVFVKPACAGSSVGVTKANNRDELINGIEIAFKEDRKIVIEKGAVDFYEVECAVLGNEKPVAGEVGEIVSCKEIYDYEAKYINPASQLFIPARISEEKRKEVAELAVKTYSMLGCEGLSRVDFFVTKKDGHILFNEINTIPGFTSISMYPKLMGAVGIEYSDLIDRLFELAIERNEAKA